VSFAECVLAVFQNYVQGDLDCEAGGILIGSLHGPNIAVVGATAPTWLDRRFRVLFERMPFGHNLIAQVRWKASGGKVRYLGEWHTHPENFPSPSSIDRTEWNVLSRKRADGRPMLAVIVGRKGLYVELVPREGSGLVLVSVEQTNARRTSSS
jgi:integrative and conjugative element protein (TIGR02256 family)